MNPSFLNDEAPSVPPSQRVWSRLKRAACCGGRIVGGVVTVLFKELRPKPNALKVEVGTSAQRIVRALAYRLAFAPIALALILSAIVFTGTHPRVMASETDPSSLSIYYDPVNYFSEDGTRSEAWLVPVLDEHRVLRDGDAALRKRQPAVVLVHDYRQSREQMLPLIRPLHEAGIVVLVVGLRGAGSGHPVGTTFGLHESFDVKAGVELLRRRPFVDPGQIAILGVGTGATAALLAADRDPGIAALVLNDPIHTATEMISESISPRSSWLKWMQPMCKWTFELAYGVNADDANLNEFTDLMARRPVLMLNTQNGLFDARQTQQIVAFLSHRLHVR